MTIHHSQIKKAEKMGVILTERDDLIDASWPKRAVMLRCSSPADAIAQMQAVIAIASSDEYKIAVDDNMRRLIYVYRDSDGYRLDKTPMTAVEAHGLIFGGKAEWVDPVEMTGEPGDMDDEIDTSNPHTNDAVADGTIPATVPTGQQVERSASGVALNGAIAYREGTPAADCPYSSEGQEDEGDDSPEYENFIRWNEEWDAAADEAAEEEEGKGGSVVSEKYRAKYAEAGHPTHCGDWLAETMNELCLNKAGTNLELFEAICALNGVDTSKYKREGVGWQGRIRMTGRNLVAKKVYLNGGKLIVPDTLGGFKQAPAEWMATQRYKMPAAVQAAPTPVAAE